MDHNRFGSIGYSAEDRPVLTGHVDKEAWITGLVDYVNSMRAYCPGVTHPLEEGLTEGFSLFSSDQKPSAAAVSAHQGDSAMAQSLEDMHKTLDKHTRRNTAQELRAR